LALSHQRVHQLVDAGPRRLRPGRGRRRQENLTLRSCSFCGIGQPGTQRLIAGPNVFICDGCVDLARGVVDAGGEAANDRVRLEAVGREASLSCSFCGKTAGRVSHRLVAGPGVAICGECVDLRLKIRADQTHTSS
jgi:ATP-dependent protease Clp ATPase subunit